MHLSSAGISEGDGEKDKREASGREGQGPSAEAPSQGEQTRLDDTAGAVKANEAMGDGNAMRATHEILKQSETSAAALMAAYSTFGDRAMPFVPFAPLFDLCL